MEIGGSTTLDGAILISSFYQSHFSTDYESSIFCHYKDSDGFHISNRCKNLPSTATHMRRGYMVLNENDNGANALCGLIQNTETPQLLRLFALMM